ncbi:MAG TPA: dUTP diphosphatase [Victivallales bacterium]|nr:dUTP diphosphatase [Victivallales bacterium]HPO90006.1 dUTP diphosphatase [Victivallales bacterium]HRR07021.1 dUTP diphosphatase [Victivallales bacterium]HRU02418.1 dUTP diphosphatase [Victivallales bacterium]
MQVKVKIKMMEDCNDLTPKKAHHDDAAFDLCSRIDIELKPSEPHLIPTGIFMEIPPGYEGQVRPRSGLAIKHAITVLNSPGTIDAGYRGEVAVIVMNCGKKPYHVKRGDRIAQLVINKLPEVEIEIANELSETKRGTGGFGSTGKA